MNKKRIGSLVLAFALLVSLAVGVFAAVKAGDVDGDGRITAFDAQMIAEYKAGQRQLDDTQLEAAGDLSVQDVIDDVLSQEPEEIYAVAGLLTDIPPEPVRLGATGSDHYKAGYEYVTMNHSEKSISVELQGITGSPAGLEFYDQGQPISSDAWAVSFDMSYQITTTKNGIMSFFVTEDASNAATFKIVHKSSAPSYLNRSIYRDGERMQQESGDEHLLQLPTSTEWSGKIMLMFYDGWIYFFMQNDAGQYLRVTSYEVDYETATPQFEVSRYMNLQLTNINAVTDKEQVAALYNELLVPEEVKGTHRALFLSNSNIFYFDTPNTFARLAKEAGYYVEVNAVAGSGASIANFNDTTNYLHTLYQQEIQRGYDVVYFNGLAGDTNSEEKMATVSAAAGELAEAIRAAGSTPALYCRPPRKLVDDDGDGVKETLVVLTNGKAYDEFYTAMGETYDMDVCYPVRAFALAYQENPDIGLWYTDHAHASQAGAYLNGCVMFCHTFGVSCENVGDDFLDAETAAFLRDIADRVVLEGEMPNW